MALALACPICFGASDAPVAQAMNWGVLSLLAITVTVLASFGLFFLRLARVPARLKSRPTSEVAGPNAATHVGPNFSSAEKPS